MKKIVFGMVFVMVCSFSGMAEGLRSAGALLVDLSADSVTAADGNAITQWANAGTLGGNFATMTGSTGPTFTNSLLGKKALLFNGTLQSVLTNCVVPASLTGVNPWSVETWVWVSTWPAAKSIYLSWTKNDGTGGGGGQDPKMMLRYDAGNGAVDHKGSTLGFGYGIPPAGAWHHIVATRSAFGTETLYVDGNFSAYYGAGNVGLESGNPLALGAVAWSGATQYTNFFAGALSRVRIHTGALSEQDVRNNFLADAWAYATNNAVWSGGAGNWNDAANWTNSNVGGSGKGARVLAGTVGVTNNVAASALAALDIVSGTVSLSDVSARLDGKTPYVIGRNAGNAATLNVQRGTIAINGGAGPTVVDMGQNGAASALSVGGADSATTLLASQVRAFAGGSASLQINSNGVLELDSIFADNVTNVSVRAVGGTLRNKTGSTMGYLYNVSQVKISTGGLIFDAVSGSQMAVSASLLHDDSGPAADGGLRKISVGKLILSGTNSYAGATSVEAGTLALAPRLLDGLVYRLDSSTNALSTLQFDGTSNVVAWADANGSGFLFTTNKSEKCPVYDAALFGGRGGLRFTRDSTICRLAANRAAREQSVFAVISPATGNSIGGLWGQSEGDYGIRVNGTSIQYVGNGNDFSSSGWVYMNGIPGNAFTVGQPVLMTAIAGSAQTWTTAIGDYWGHTTYRRGFRGDIAEILVYDRRLDDRERQAVEAYLMAKWLGTVSAPQFASTLLPVNNALSVTSGASVELGGTSAQLSSLRGSGIIGNGSSTRSVLTVGGLDADSFYAGTITGNVAITKIGSGSVLLAGPNTYMGLTTISTGMLRLVLGGIPSVTGLVYRLDASRTNTFTTLSNGSNVTAWADAEGRGFTFATTNDLNCPVYDRTLFNGRGGLRFGLSGARGRMIGSAVTNAQTVFAVNMIRDFSNDNGGLWGMDANDNGLRLGGASWYFPGNGNDFHYVGAGGLVAINGVVSNSVATVGQPHLVTSVSGSRQSFKPAIGDYWGSSAWPGRYYRGEVAEILVYDRKLTDTERQSVEFGLMAKWFPLTGNGYIIPQNTEVSVAAGAMLDIGGGAVTLSALSGGGSVSNGALTVTGLVSPKGTLRLPGAPSLTGTLTLGVTTNSVCDSLAVSGALDVSQLALVVNVPVTKPVVTSYTLVSASGGITGNFKSVAVARPWMLVYGSTSVRLVYFSGTLIGVL